MVMRNLYLFLLILLPLFCISCYDDKGNYDYHALNQAEVAGIDSMYTAIFMEKLVITPTIQSEDKERVYDYIWMCYDKNDFRKKYRYFVFRERFGLYGFVVIVFLSVDFCVP